MNKSVKLLFCLVFCCFFMTGCVDMNASLTINKDRSADVNVKTLVEKSAYPMMRKEIDKMKKSYSGSKIVNIEKGKRVGISVTTHTPDITNVQISGFPIAFEPNNIKYLNIKKGFFKDVFVFDNTVDFSDKKKNSQENEYMDYLAGSYMEDSHFNFTMNLPVKADDSNAGEVNNGGKTLKWVLLYGEKNKLYARFTLLNWTNIILTSIASVLLIILSILGIIYRKPLAEKFKNADYKLITKKILVTGSVIAGLCLIGWGIYAGYSYYQAKINNVALYPIYENGKWGYIDETGKVVIKPQYDNFSFPQNGVIKAFKLKEKISATERKNFLQYYRLKFIFLRDDTLEESYTDKNIDDLTVSDKTNLEFDSKESWQNLGKLFFIDKFGNPVDGSKYYHNLTPVAINHPKWDSSPTGQEKWGYVNNKSEWVVIPQFDKAYPFTEGLAAVKMKNKWGYIDESGDYLIKPQFDEAYKFNNGMARIKNGSKYGYINKKGEIAISPQFECAKAFTEGLAPILKDKKWGYINKKGNYIINPEFDYAGTFSENFAIVSTDKTILINRKGEKITTVSNDKYFSTFDNGIAIGQYGYLDKSGKYTKVFSEKDFAEPIQKIYLKSQMNEGKYCYVDINGRNLYCFKWL